MVLFIAVTLLTVIGAFYAIENWRGAHAWQRYLAASQARGDKNSLADFIPAPVLAASNFTKTPLLERAAYKSKPAPEINAQFASAAALFDSDIGDFHKGTWTCFECSGDRSGQPSAESTQGAQRFLAALQPIADSLAELRRAAERPFSQFEMGNSPFEDTPNFVFLRNLARVLSARALAELTLGDPASAFADVQVIEKLADGLRSQPTLVDAMIRCALLDLPDKQPFYEGWARRQWTESQYRQFQQFFAGADLLQNVDLSMRAGERVGVQQLTLTRTAKELVDILNLTDRQDSSLAGFLKQTGFLWMPRGWWLQNLVVHHQLLDHGLAKVYERSQVRVNGRACNNAASEVDQALKASWPFHCLAAVSIPNYGRAFQRAAVVHILNQQAMLVCALERYHIRNGRYPQTLSELAPDYAPTLPKDPILGQSLNYERLPDGTFSLFSPGWHRQTRNPTAQPKQPGPDDFVWPYPSGLTSGSSGQTPSP
jgi:hypothetical protein